MHPSSRNLFLAVVNNAGRAQNITPLQRRNTKTLPLRQVQPAVLPKQIVEQHQFEAAPKTKLRHKVTPATLPAEAKVGVIYKERRVQVHTCSELYREWRETREGYKHCSPDGFVYETPYIHTGLDRRGDPNAPTILALHGAPGTYRDFSSIIDRMDAEGCNVIAPTFPDLHYTMRTQNFFHTLEEKTDLLKKYLEAIGCKRVDMLVCHSSSMYPAIQLALTNPDIEIGSLVFAAPAGCRQLTQLSPLPLFKWFERQFHTPWKQKALMDFAKLIIKMYNKPSEDLYGTVVSMMTMVHSKYDQTEPLVRELVANDLPMLMFYGERDRLIDIEISKEMADFIGVNRDEYTVYEGKTEDALQLVKKGNTSGRTEAVCFKHGTHFAFKRYPDTFNKHIIDFYRRNVLKT